MGTLNIPAPPGLLHLYLLFATFGGRVDRRQADAMAYPLDLTRMLNEQVDGGRL